MAVSDTWYRTVTQADGSSRRERSASYGRGKRWTARYRDEQGQQKSPKFRTRAEAETHLKRVEGELQRGEYVAPEDGKATFSDYFATWSARQIWAPGTLRAMTLAAKSVTFSHVPLRSLRRSHIETWVKGMETRGLAAGTIKTRFNNVRAVLRGAVRDRVIPTDPSEGVPLPRARRRGAAMTLPTVEQVRTLMDAAPENFAPFIAVCAFGGLRSGEARALQADDIDSASRTLAVRRQAQRTTGNTLEIRPPKHGSERTVSLPDALVEILSRHLAAHCADRWLFCRQQDRPWGQGTVDYYWRTTRSAAGVAGVKLHDLRHFYASGLIAQGCDVVTVQRALGHASASITLSTYSHLWPDAADRTRAAAAALMVEAGALAPSCAPNVRPD